MIDLNHVAAGLRKDPRGYWVAGARSSVSYPEEGNSLCFAVEDGSFWFQHRNLVIVEAARQFPPAGPIFDVGGGNGFVSQGLEAAGFETVVVEPGPAGAANACRRGLPHVICATVETAGLPPRSLPAIGLFDVLEHIDDDRGFLTALHELLTSGGKLYITVPAFQFLWSDEDDHAGHFRRHSLTSLDRLLNGTGFRIDYLTYFFWFLPLPVLLLRAIPSRLGLRAPPSVSRGRREHAAGKGAMGWLIDRALGWELGRIRGRSRIPFGGSCLAVASKPT